MIYHNLQLLHFYNLRSDLSCRYQRYKTILRDLVDMSLVKNCYFINLCFGVTFVCTSDYGFSSLLPLMMTDAGYPKAYAALSVTISGIAELASKILLSIFTLIINVKSKYIFFIATIIMGFARIGQYIKFYSNSVKMSLQIFSSTKITYKNHDVQVFYYTSIRLKAH